MSSPQPPIISVMLAVPDAVRAVEWYERALGAKQLWNLGSVVGLDVQGAAFFVGEPSNNGWDRRRSDYHSQHSFNVATAPSVGTSTGSRQTDPIPVFSPPTW